MIDRDVSDETPPSALVRWPAVWRTSVWLWLILTQLGVAGCGVGRPGPAHLEPSSICPDAEGYTAVRGVFRGVCASAVPSWAELRYDAEGTPADAVQLAGVCNPNGYALKLTLHLEGSNEEVTLGPNECSEPYKTRVQSALVVPLDQNLALAADCSTTDTRPPADVYVDLFVACRP